MFVKFNYVIQHSTETTLLYYADQTLSSFCESVWLRQTIYIPAELKVNKPETSDHRPTACVAHARQSRAAIHRLKQALHLMQVVYTHPKARPWRRQAVAMSQRLTVFMQAVIHETRRRPLKTPHQCYQQSFTPARKLRSCFFATTRSSILCQPPSVVSDLSWTPETMFVC